MLKNAIEVKNLSKRYGNKLVLDNVSFAVPAGTIHGLIGPNGAGKSTIINIIRRLVLPNSPTGRSYDGVYVNGKSVRSDPSFNEKLGSAPAEPEFLEDKVGEHLLSVGYLHDRPAAEVLSKLEKSKLREFYSTRHVALSTGWKKILQVFTLIIFEYKIFVLDEVMNGLDPSVRKQVFDFIEKVVAQGGTVFISTHILSDLRQMKVSGVTMIKNGRILYTGPAPADLEKAYEEYFGKGESIFEL